MFPKPSKIFLAAALVWAVLALALFDTIYAWQWLHIQFHSTIETLGGVTACLIAVVLFIKSQEKLDAHLLMLATGFAGMGILDMAHAIGRPGDAFIFLHSVASLCGGFFFASVWFCRNRQMRSLLELKFIFFGFIALTASVGFRALLFPDDVPKIMPLFNGKFTMAAVLINLTAGCLFFASVFEFYGEYRQKAKSLDLLFASLAVLFGIAACIFPFSTPWNGTWWVWHLIRFIAFAVTLVYIFKAYGHNLLEDAGRTGKDKGQEG